MKTSASSMPASRSASISRPWPSVNRPPASSQVVSMPESSRSWESGSSSRTETSWPWASIARATVDPTRPAPTIKMNDIEADSSGSAVKPESRLTNASAANRRRGGAAVALDVLRVGLLALARLARRRRGEDHLARRLGDHVLRDLADEVVQRPAAPAEQRAAADLRRLLGGEDDGLHAAALGLVDDRLPGAPRAHRRGRDLDALVLLPHRLRPRQRRPGALELLLGEGGVDRQRHRDLEDPQRLDRRAVVRLEGLGVLLGREAPGRLHDVVVERRAEDRHEDRAVLGVVALPAQRLLGHDDALEQRLALRAAVRDVERDPAPEPAEADPARAVVGEHDADPREQREDRAGDRRQRQVAAADA